MYIPLCIAVSKSLGLAPFCVSYATNSDLRSLPLCFKALRIAFIQVSFSFTILCNIDMVLKSS